MQQVEFVVGQLDPLSVQRHFPFFGVQNKTSVAQSGWLSRTADFAPFAKSPSPVQPVPAD